MESRGIPAITGQVDAHNALHVYPETLRPFRGSINAYGASIVSTFIGFPLDTIKTRMQTHRHYRSYLHCISSTYRHEGAAGFFRGVFAPLVSTSFSKSLSVSIFTQVKPGIYQATFGDSEPQNPFLRNIPVCFASGVVAGGGVSVFACPFEFTKIYAQLEILVAQRRDNKFVSASQHMDPNQPRLSTMQIVRRIVQHQGPAGLYSGFRWHLIRDSLSSGVYYSIYESFKYAMNVAMNGDPTQASSVSILLAGGLSGVVSWALIFPVDTTKSLIQKDMVINILRRSQGQEALSPVRRFPKFDRKAYRGLSISMCRSFVVNMVFFGVYEMGMTYLG